MGASEDAKAITSGGVNVFLPQAAFAGEPWRPLLCEASCI